MIKFFWFKIVRSVQNDARYSDVVSFKSKMYPKLDWLKQHWQIFGLSHYIVHYIVFIYSFI
jgi:hypothetical protein